MNLTTEQLAAVQLDAKEVSIHAGAGAGKTAVMVERYLRHVQEGVSPEKILTITFTRKAAAEMKGRIVRRLRENGNESAARIAQIGPISTVHSFCERTLREYPFDAAVDPGFDVLDEVDTDRILRIAVMSAVGKHDELSVHARNLVVKLFGRHSRGDRTINASSQLHSTVASFVNGLRMAGADMETLRLLSSPSDLGKHWEDSLRTDAANALKIASEEIDSLDKTYLKTLFREAGARAPGWVTSQGEVFDEVAVEDTAGLIEIALRAWKSLETEFSKHGALDFTALELMMCRLVEKRGAVLAGKYSHLLVDEAQDLNPLQHRILQALPVAHRLFIGDPQQSIYRFRGADRELFVGRLAHTEVKHLSINFRSTQNILNLSEHLFSKLWPEHFEKMLTPQPKKQDSDDPFSSAAWDESAPAIQIWRYDPFSFDGIINGVADLIANGESPRDITLLLHARGRLEELSRQLERRKIPYLPSDRGVHFYSRNEVRDTLSALRALCDQSDNISMLSLLRSPLVGLSLDAIAAIGMEANEKSKSVWTTIQTGYMLPSQQDTILLKIFLAWFSPLAECADRLPAWDALSRLFSAADQQLRFAMMEDGLRQFANAQKLIETAMDHPALSPREFAEWLEGRQSVQSRIPDAPTLSDETDAVRMATAHSAKGLEWKNVVLLASNRPGFSPVEFLKDYQHNLFHLNLSKKNSMIRNKLLNEARVADDAEQLRLLYVALTRAKNRLCIAIPNGDSNDQWAKLLETELVRRPIPGALIEFAKSNLK